jgi:hypothetical protein
MHIKTHGENFVELENPVGLHHATAEARWDEDAHQAVDIDKHGFFVNGIVWWSVRMREQTKSVTSVQ